MGGHGWIGPGAEANAYAEGTETPPDLKESYSLGAETADRRPRDRPNLVRPQRLARRGARLQSLVNEYTAAMRQLSDDLLALFAHALGLPANPFTTSRTGRPGR